jgi:hypothetical protein
VRDYVLNFELKIESVNIFDINVNYENSNILIEYKLDGKARELKQTIYSNETLVLKLKKYNTKPHKNFNFLILANIIYQHFDFENEQLSIPDEFKAPMHSLGFNFECFGSCFNTYADNEYCSLCYDIMEQYFGSRGNFYDYSLENKKYLCNPPYQHEFEVMTLIKF